MVAKEKDTKNQYGAAQITVLEGLDPVRKRPGMYIGSTGVDGLHHLVWEVVDNSIDEAMAGHADTITVRLLKKNRVSVEDNGRGIPVDLHPQFKVSALELVLTKLHAGGKFGGGGYKVSGGLHGVGVSVVNALSIYMKAEVHRDGKIWVQEYKRGKPEYKVKPVGKTTKRGTIIIFEPDAEIFSTLEFNWDTILDHLRQQAYLTKGVHLIIADERGEELTAYEFYFEGGVKSYVRHLNHNKPKKHDAVFYVHKEETEVDVEIAIQYTDEYKDLVFTFANNIFNPDGGSHLVGFRSALTRSLNNYARTKGYLKEKDDNLTGDDVREGLTAVVSVKVKDPQFEGQTKAKLGNPEVRTAVEAVMGLALEAFLEENPKDAEAIIEKNILASRARLAAKAARDTILRKGVLEGLTLPGKLADCSSRDASQAELFIVEGDSAGGCFSGSTKVALADGRNLSFEELVREDKLGKKNFCYTIFEDGHVGLAPIINPRITQKNAKVIKIILDNDKEIICTPDHQFMLRHGVFKAAMELQTADSLMPLYRQYSKLGQRITIEGYEMVFDPKDERWIFTHLLADQYNLNHKIYQKGDGAYRHHFDFNKLNNNPDNLLRVTKEQHLTIHKLMVEKTIQRPDVILKTKQAHQTKEYRELISKIMRTPKMRKLLSGRAKKQWQNAEYKTYMLGKFLEFYKNNAKYQKSNNALLNRAQKEYWSHPDNRLKQSQRVKDYFEQHSEKRLELKALALSEWDNPELRHWRSQKTKEQWTDDFRIKRIQAYNETYRRKALETLHKIYEQQGAVDLSAYEQHRQQTNDKSLLRHETILARFFNNDKNNLKTAVELYNHKIKQIIILEECIDVYDLEVPGTHNFALASGIFVHNSAKQGRNREFQAILPLRGKILNVERARLDKLLANNELKALVIAMGTNIAEQFDVTKLRYGRVIIMTDADVDGAHIRTLLLTLFYRYFPELIKQEHIFIAQPPLYRIARGKEAHYAYDDAEKEKILAAMEKQVAAKGGKNPEEPEVEEVSAPTAAEGEEEVKIKGVSLQRYKGLGEMNPEQLWETTMDPATRLLKRVTIPDAEKADEIFDILMGAEVEPRKHFIQTHAKAVKNLDV